ncbi:hypothetical protein UF75_3640 [Desulfosporosinus sp. I2]|nr:hypothetical protein UF75_3640 [Desulfosporosinus sp. I2]
MWSTAFRERFIAEDDRLLTAKHNRNNGELFLGFRKVRGFEDTPGNTAFNRLIM